MKRALMSQYKQVKLGEFILATKLTEKYELFLLLKVDASEYAIKFTFPANYPLVQPEVLAVSINRKYKIGEKICLGEVRKDTILEYIYLFMSKTMDEPDKYDIKNNIITDSIKEISDNIFDI